MKNILRFVVLVLVVGAIIFLQSRKLPRAASRTTATAPALVVSPQSSSRADAIAAKARRYKRAPEISTPDGFINADRVSLGQFIGKKVVLLDFWTYSCINCQRSIPYLNAWYEKYSAKGLVIIGIHTPEFQFEQKYDNVVAAVKKFGIQYPVVLDNDYSTWTDYGNRYWPREYLIDIDGFIVHDHIGEGGYDETEKSIQTALEERMTVLGAADHIGSGIVHPAAAVESQAQSPETYFGSGRNVYLANGVSSKDGVQTLAVPSTVATDKLYLVGTWNFRPEYAKSAQPNARVIFRYRAKNVYLVSSADHAMRAELLLDGHALGNRAGKDVVDEGGKSIVHFAGDGLSHLVSDSDGASEHTLEILLPDPGLLLYTLTFG